MKYILLLPPLLSSWLNNAKETYNSESFRIKVENIQANSYKKRFNRSKIEYELKTFKRKYGNITITSKVISNNLMLKFNFKSALCHKDYYPFLKT